ncbi:ATP-dependent DNA ligase [Pseudovirgaria hyperparasitica]|uniref:DNA ligase n=1 Tax=Pseudovirgaria hyperparasitica TaxID=470096 RepID=A0A6A6WCL6_9PEZI|nr:ATP-dependent DNA ligase [Pseudovirgaria hyperparasitica]KAF2758851.1 ATP-dependent DNA ligase [Pseudovirgaria hyperparasitica]
MARVRDIRMQDADAAEEERKQYIGENLKELDTNYPNRPHNHSKTLPFHELYSSLFNPLNENKKKPTGPVQARRKQGPHGPANLSPHEVRRNIVERFISRWRNEVGNDIYPAFRLIVPEKDRDRSMYGLKEKAIAKILIKVLRIDRNSDGAYGMLNWKLPGRNSTTANAGDFAGRCYEVLKGRQMRSSPGLYTIGDVNEMLNRLSAISKEEEQLPLFQQFYSHMNAEEMTWLIRIILRQMKVGATEKTFFDIWHPDAEQLFNISSSLRRVCWELYDPTLRLQGSEVGVALMQCFQPQLAQFQEHTFDKVLSKMHLTEDDNVFWIEEKLDGERMQLHMVQDESVAGGVRFNFWSRKAKDYTYLYGNGLQDENSALTRHLRKAFKDGVRNIILDGEMITWSMEQKAIVPFGTLKTAALSEQKNPYGLTNRPVFRVFDCLFLNDTPLTKYTLRDRRRALESSIENVPDRLEIHPYQQASSKKEIETELRKVVADSSEGLVIKNPRSIYRLNSRNDDWVKVKPEYMSEFGEELDCVVIGGYYGSGHRGGNLSSFLCGLRFDSGPKSLSTQVFHSFFKVGGGFAAQDYAEIRERTEGKWVTWDPKKPPKHLIELGGLDKQYERPDVYINPRDSLVVSVKAASVTPTDQFRTQFTLRFPRFKKLRLDKDWESALTYQGFLDLKHNAEQEQQEKKFELMANRKQRSTRSRKRPLIVAGTNERVETPYAGPQTRVFEGMTFHVLTEALKPQKRNKAELEQLIKSNGGNIIANARDEKIICIADRRPLAVAAIEKRQDRSVVRPLWLFDCIAQSNADASRPKYLLPYEPSHLLFGIEEDQLSADNNIDKYGDSYARDLTPDGLKELFRVMPKMEEEDDDDEVMDVDDAEGDEIDMGGLPGCVFRGVVVYFDNGSSDTVMEDEDVCSTGKEDKLSMFLATNIVRFGSGRTCGDLDDCNITHVVIGKDRSRLKDIRSQISHKTKVPRMVTTEWIQECWTEKTLLDEERFTPQ